MNKKLFALLLVSAFALQLKAAEPEERTSTSRNDRSADEGGGRRRRGSEREDNGEGVGSHGEGENKSTTEGGSQAPDNHSAPAGSADNGRASSSAADGGDDHSSTPSPFEMPGKNDGKVVGFLNRVKAKVWTSKVDATNIKNILKYGAENYASMNESEKAAYFNAQDAQWGLQTSRAIKLACALGVVSFIKLVRDVMNEQDDEDEDEVEA